MPDDLFAASHALMGQKTVTQFWLDKMKEEWQAEAVAAERERIRAAVEGLGWTNTTPRWGDDITLAAVLAIIDEADHA